MTETEAEAAGAVDGAGAGLSADREARHPDAAAMAADLRKVLAGAADRSAWQVSGGTRVDRVIQSSDVTLPDHTPGMMTVAETEADTWPEG